MDSDVLVLLSNLKYWTLNPEESGPTIDEIVEAHRACKYSLRGPFLKTYENTVLYKRGAYIIGSATHGGYDLKDLTRWDKIKNEIK